MAVKRFRSEEEVRALLNIDADGVPLSVSPRQFRLALDQKDLHDKVDAAVAAADKATQISWEYADVIKRGDALVALIATSLNLSKSKVDDLFKLAATL